MFFYRSNKKNTWLLFCCAPTHVISLFFSEKSQILSTKTPACSMHRLYYEHLNDYTLLQTSQKRVSVKRISEIKLIKPNGQRNAFFLNSTPYMLYAKEKKHLLLRIRQVADVYVKRTKTCLFHKMFEPFL